MPQKVSTKFDEDAVKDVIRGAIAQSRTSFDRKKKIFQRNDQLYAKSAEDQVDTQNGQITTNALYSAVQLLLAQNESNPLRPTFVPVGRSPRDSELANTLEAIALRDEIVGNYRNVYGMSGKDTIYYGASFTHFYGYDSEKDVPTPHTVSPFSIILDPDGGVNLDNHRYIGSRMKYNVASLKNDQSIDQKELKELLKEGYSNDIGQGRQYDLFWSQWAGFSLTEGGEFEQNVEKDKEINVKLNRSSGFIYLTHLYFLCYDKKGDIKKYEVLTDENCTRLLKCRELEALTSAEEKNGALITYPIALEQFSYTNELDIFGLNVFSLLSHNAHQSSALLNLSFEVAKRNQSMPVFYEKGSITPDDIEYGIENFIGVNKSKTAPGPISDVISQGKVQPLNMNDISAIVDKIERFSERALAISDRGLGISEDPDVDTLGQAKILENNATQIIKKRAHQRADARARFFELWMRSKYQHYKTSGNATSINTRVTTGLTDNNMVLEKSTFEMSKIQQILVKSDMLEKEAGRIKNRVLLSLLPTIGQQVHPLVLRSYTRMIIENSDLFGDAKTILPYLPEEKKINDIRILLENDEPVMLQKVAPDVSPVIQSLFLSDIPTATGRAYSLMLTATINKMNRDRVQQEMGGMVGEAEKSRGEISQNTKPAAMPSEEAVPA